MPAYSPSTASLPITGIRRGDVPVALWLAENPLTGAKSQAVNLANSLLDAGPGPQNIRISGLFAGAPGAFTIQVETSDQDVDAAYVAENFQGGTPGQVTTVTANNGFSVELAIAAKFVRLSSVLQNANAVKLTATISRA